MNYQKLGVCRFILFGTPDTSQARVKIEARVVDSTAYSQDILVSQSWLLMLESQIGKVPKQIQDVVLDALFGQTHMYFKYNKIPPLQSKTENMRHLATLEIELCLGDKLFVLAHPRDFDRRLRAEGLASLLMVNSFSALCDVFQGQMRDVTLYMLVYGLHKWETTGRPGNMTAFTQTWDFTYLENMVKRGIELVAQDWAPKIR